METLGVIFTITAIISGRLLAWTYTKSGKKWLSDL
jgi:hypothetical protein